MDKMSHVDGSLLRPFELSFFSSGADSFKEGED